MLTPSRNSTKIELKDINTMIGIFRASERLSSGRFGGVPGMSDMMKTSDTRVCRSNEYVVWAKIEKERLVQATCAGQIWLESVIFRPGERDEWHGDRIAQLFRGTRRLSIIGACKCIASYAGSRSTRLEIMDVCRRINPVTSFASRLQASYCVTKTGPVKAVRRHLTLHTRPRMCILDPQYPASNAMNSHMNLAYASSKTYTESFRYVT
jgi:hypothetical protein